MKKRLLVRPAALLPALALTGCGLLPGQAEDTRTVTVWLMKGSASDAFLERFTSTYERENPGVRLEIVIQEWTGIGKKVSTALAGETPPDIIEVGNTQVAQYAETDRLFDLTLESVRDLGHEEWLPGLAEPGSIDGSQYGIPWYAANRVVIYRKDLFARAGIEEPPKTREQWLEDTERINRTGAEGIYLAGQDWYTLAGFVWDEGGELAEEKNGRWSGTLHTPAALRGMEFYKDLQSLGSGPKDSDEENPPQTEVFAKGEVAQIIATPGAATAIKGLNPDLADELGFFPIPGKTADKPCAVFTGGSDLVIPVQAPERGAAIEVVKALAGEKWQTDLARTMNYVPNKTTLAAAVEGQEGTAAMAVGAARGRATPNSARWADVEADNPIKPYMTAVLQGRDAEAAALAASKRITEALGG
ncbi:MULTISPECIES: extracellular solute-binding protein [unclassified Streptomyces]|uniref:extracellular solute-binding protein n=1 Tax=unclassified Streptomyces TaxID=2593676 RepID=UPI0008DE75AA|nr:MULTISPECIES: extracellular solute-binding protein [unclassified Streptomyces]OII65500.1 sugar transporter [Streptomyces sp. CC77]